LALGAFLLLWAACAQLARALPLNELFTHPRALPGMMLALAGLSLVAIARQRTRPGLALAGRRGT